MNPVVDFISGTCSLIFKNVIERTLNLQLRKKLSHRSIADAKRCTKLVQNTQTPQFYIKARDLSKCCWNFAPRLLGNTCTTSKQLRQRNTVRKILGVGQMGMQYFHMCGCTVVKNPPDLNLLSIFWWCKKISIYFFCFCKIIIKHCYLTLFFITEFFKNSEPKIRYFKIDFSKIYDGCKWTRREDH